MMGKIKKLLIFFLNIPLYFLAKVIPKHKNIWIFGAWFGDKYADNSKYLFEYVCKYHPDVRAIWLTKNEKTLNLIRSKGYEAYLSYSPKGYLYSSKSSISFVSTSFKDVNIFIPSPCVVNLWHGNPLKKVVYDDKINKTNNFSIERKMIRALFPFYKDPFEFDYIVASSNIEAKNLTSAFMVNFNKILITGLPRNDVFYKKNYKSSSGIKIIYMPTHRNERGLNIGKLFYNHINELNDSLGRIGCELDIKLHFYNLQNNDFGSYSNIKFLLDYDIEQDIYSIISNYDILITDYSSIFFDYLLSDKPIIFSSFDYKEYIVKDRELYYDYDKITPGPKCKDWNEVLEWVIKFKENPSLYKEERENIKNKFHKYQDGRSCERVYNYIISRYPFK